MRTWVVEVRFDLKTGETLWEPCYFAHDLEGKILPHISHNFFEAHEFKRAIVTTMCWEDRPWRASRFRVSEYTRKERRT